jgi:uncharacterized paraquat-inducible protein A
MKAKGLPMNWVHCDKCDEDVRPEDERCPKCGSKLEVYK